MDRKKKDNHVCDDFLRKKRIMIPVTICEELEARSVTDATINVFDTPLVLLNDWVFFSIRFVDQFFEFVIIILLLTKVVTIIFFLSMYTKKKYNVNNWHL